MVTNKLKILARQFGYDIGHFPDWRLVFKEVDLLVDVGANHGQTYDYFRMMGWDGPVVSYEGWEPTFRKLMKKEGRDWYRRLAMLGECSGEKPFFVQPDVRFDGTNSLLDNRQACDTLERTTVKIRRLDSENIPGQSILLKIDAEGTDYKVFLGAEALWPRIKWVMMELSTFERFKGEVLLSEVIGEMFAIGYSVSFIDRQYIDHKHRRYPGCEAMDVVFRKVIV